MRWPWRRKPEPPDDDHEFLRAIGWIDDDGKPIPSPERAKPETPQARRPWDAVPLHELIGPLLADATETIPNPLHTKETPVTTPEPPLDELDQTARDYLAHPGAQRQTAWLIVHRLSHERRRLHRELTDARRDAPAVGSAAGLRDLADRLQQYNADRGGETAVPEHSAETPYLIREYADEVERNERQTAADTRDRERVEPILAARWAKDRDRQFLPSLVPTWDDLTDEERAHCIDYGLELYRAGRDDQEADHA